MRVLIADDEVLLREGLARLLEDAGFEVAGRCGDAGALLRMVEAAGPRSRRRHPHAAPRGRRRARGGSGDPPPPPRRRRARALPSSRSAMRLLEEAPERAGYLLKERVSDVAVLADALRRIGEGECVIDPTIVSQLVAASAGAGRSTS